MKKLSLILLFVAIIGGVLYSCREEIKTCAGQIKELNDSVMVTKIGDYDISFDIKKAEFSNGAVMLGDSVTVHYIGDMKDKHARALIIYLMPKPGHVIDAVYDPSKKLEVSEKPLTPAEEKQTEEYLKAAKAKQR